MDASDDNRVRCPAPGCGAVFPVRAERVGRMVHCPVCRRRLTARPLAVDAALAARGPRRSAAPAAGRGLPLAALIDDVRSLWNVGSIFRSADGCGVRMLYLAGITGHPPRPEISKTALGAELSVAWSYCAEAAGALAQATAAGYTPVALERTARSLPLDAAPWPARPCLVVGNEVAGVSPALLESCPLHVHIPMRGVKVSLNVAVAFGIAAHAASRALAGGGARPAPVVAGRAG